MESEWETAQFCDKRGSVRLAFAIPKIESVCLCVYHSLQLIFPNGGSYSFQFDSTAQFFTNTHKGQSYQSP